MTVVAYDSQKRDQGLLTYEVHSYRNPLFISTALQIGRLGGAAVLLRTDIHGYVINVSSLCRRTFVWLEATLLLLVSDTKGLL